MANGKKLYDLNEALTIIPMSKAGIYKACTEGKIPSVRVGRRVFIPSWYIEKIISEPGA
ncbi:helix-turn-helix domain-containing protein [Propionispora vibrioides]|uniref:Helix-turn-helix domain-containing protein n=1 Tax=Propionispora vibrioides TaxID=112903 RepID=A0A1H8Y3E9_9FIRM|nr:hypothetical protein SAMN04490178_14111 [Propionispora vibrioides]